MWKSIHTNEVINEVGLRLSKVVKLDILQSLQVIYLLPPFWRQQPKKLTTELLQIKSLQFLVTYNVFKDRKNGEWVWKKATAVKKEHED